MKNYVRRIQVWGYISKLWLRQQLRQNKVSELNIAIMSGNPVGSWNLWYKYTSTLRQKMRQWVFGEFNECFGNLITIALRQKLRRTNLFPNICNVIIYVAPGKCGNSAERLRKFGGKFVEISQNTVTLPTSKDYVRRI